MKVTNAFPAIRRKTSPTPIGRISGYLSSGIKRLESNASRVSDWFGFVHKSFELDPKLFGRIILLQPSASIPDGPHHLWSLLLLFELFRHLCFRIEFHEVVLVHRGEATLFCCLGCFRMFLF